MTQLLSYVDCRTDDGQAICDRVPLQAGGRRRVSRSWRRDEDVQVTRRKAGRVRPGGAYLANGLAKAVWLKAELNLQEEGLAP